MSKTIDSRVVEMQFNNKQFERDVSTSMSTIEKLKSSLNMEGVSKGFDNIGAAAKNIDMSGLGEAVDSVRIKFSALEVMVVTVLANITNSAINAGKRIVSALTIEPISEGFAEYELKMGSIQTIMAGTGESLETVNRYLDELNVYADRTIYSFADMTSNIGKFTNAGVSLKDSVAAIQGVSNVAAVSGANTNEASRAMYNFAQALSAGYVKLIDWKSIEIANMATVEFKTQLLETAVAAGTVTKSADGMYTTLKGNVFNATRNFNDVLQDQWMTTEVLVETLGKYADETTDIGKKAFAAAQDIKTLSQLFDTLKEAAGSGWAQTWEILIGDFEEAKELLTELGGVIGGLLDRTSDARNELFSLWKENGGRETLIEAFRNSFEALGKIIKPISEAFRDIFPPTTSEQLINLSNGIKAFTERLKIGDETAANIKSTFKGLFALLDIGRMALTAIVSGISDLIKTLFPVTGNFLSLTGGIGDFIVAIRDALKSSDTFNVAIQNIGKVLKPVAEGIVMFTDLIANAFKAVRAPDMTGIDEFTGQIEERFQPLIKIGEAIKGFFSFFYNLASTIGKIFGSFSDSILKSLNDADFNAIFDFINSGLFAAILYGIKKFIDSLTRITDSAGGFLGGITDIFDGVRGCLAAYQSQLKAGILLKIAISIGILAAALFTISMIDSEKLTASLMAMTAMFIELFGAMAVFNAIAGVKGFFAITAMTTGMIGLSIAVLILASAMKKISDVDWPGLLKGLLGVAGLTGILVGTTKLLETSSKSLIRSSIGFVIFGTAILILTQAVKQLGGLDLANLTKGLVGVGALMAGLVLFMKYADLSGMGVMKSVGILILAGAITVLAGAVKKISSINLGDLVKGLGGLGVILASITLFINYAGDSKHIIATATSLTILGVAMNLFAVAIVKLGSMSWSEMGRGLTSFALALGAVTVALIALPNNIFIKSLALMDVAGAMLLLSQALKAFASMSWDEVARSLTALIVSLGVIIGAFVLLAKTSSIVDSFAFTVLALSIVMLAGALKTIGSLSLVQIGGALLGLAGSFVIIGAAATLLSPIIPAILGLGVAIALLGVGIAAIGGGVLALSAGLAALAVAGTAGTVALVALVTSLIGLIPYAAKTLAEGVIEFARVIGSGAPVVAQAVKDVVLAVMDVMVTLTPVVVDGLLKLLTQLLKSLLKYMPNIIKVGGELIVAFLKGVAANIQDVVEVGIDLIINFIKGVNSKLGDIVQAGFELIVAFINGLATAVEKNGGDVVDAVLNLIQSIITFALKTLGDAISLFFNIGEDIVIGLLEGIKNKISDVVTGVTNLATSAIEAAREALRSSSPSIEFKDIGLDIGAGLAIGIDKSTPKVEASSAKMSKKAVTAAEKAAAETAKVAAKAAKDAFDASVAWIDERKYYSELSLYEELDAWERVQKRYLEGTELRKKADREVYRVKQEIASADEKFSQQIIDVTREATDKKIEYEQEYYDKCKEINDKLISDIQSLNDKYDNALESRTKSLYSTYGLFDKVDVKGDVSGTGLIKNLQDQVNEFDEWTSAMSELSDKGIDSSLIDELQKMGPKSLKEIQALNSLSQPELDEYVTLWEKKSNQAKNVATKELEGMRIETRNQIRALNVQAEIDLEEQRVIFEEKTQQLAKETTETIEQMKNEWLKKIGELRKQGEKDFKTFTDNIVSIMGKPDWAGVGRGIVDGMTTGVRSEASQLADAAVDAAMDALQAAKDALGMASPSKKFAELGKYSILGFVEGLKKFNHLATSSASDVGTSTITAFKKVIANISDAIDGNMDMSPVIRPVLDLTDVKSGSLLIDELFAQTQGLNVGNVMKKLPIFYNAEDSDGINTKPSKETKVSFVQNNYSPKALSRLEIYRQTKNQISTLRGVVSTT